MTDIENFTEEQIKKLKKNLINWSKKFTSYTIAEFLSENDLDAITFEKLIDKREDFKKTYFLAHNNLAKNWFIVAENKDIPRGMLKLLNRYISFYDRMLNKHEKQTQIDINKESPTLVFQNYDKASLEDPYKRFYEANEQKRKSEN